MSSKASREFPTALLSPTPYKLHAIAARLSRASSTLRTKTINAGQIADFISWQQRVFGTGQPFSGSTKICGNG
jgi:hypothetical protein